MVALHFRVIKHWHWPVWGICITALVAMFLCIPLSEAMFSSCIRNENTWCGCGYQRTALGPCVGGDCPDGYMCVCDYCCQGCQDDCYDCALYSQYCTNTNYCDLRQKCKRTCGLCTDDTTTAATG